MLTAEENKLVTETGPGTPMGELFRRFWLPVMLSEELGAPGCDPIRVRVLNEDLVAFKDKSGQVGIVDGYCPHRGTSLFFGRNEGDGLRCVYHGWKFNVEGRCIELPFVPEGDTFKQKVKISSYPTVDKGGFIWCYMGPTEKRPPLPQWEFMDVPESHRENWKIVVDCNWLQSMEGQHDPTHAYYTHGIIGGRNTAVDLGILNSRVLSGVRLPEVVEDTEYGARWASVWSEEGSEDKWVNISHWVMPIFDPSPGKNPSPMGSAGMGNLGYSRMRVPIDDVTCMVYRVRWDHEKPLGPEFRDAHNAFLIPEKIPGTYRSKANKSNDYMIDRVLQRNYTYTGINNFPLQDIALNENQHGPIMDRTRETLTSGDEINIHIRRQLMRAARALAQGQEPIVPHRPELFLIRSEAVNVSKDKPTQEVLREVAAQFATATVS